MAQFNRAPTAPEAPGTVVALAASRVCCESAAQQCEGASAQLSRIAGMLRQLVPTGSEGKVWNSSELVRLIVGARRSREQLFAQELFADPAWDMLLELHAADVEQRRTTVTNLCDAAPVPATTALRWLSALVDHGYVERRECHLDRRKVFVELTENGRSRMQAFFERLASSLQAV